MLEIFPQQRNDSVIYHYDLARKENLNTYSYDRDVACDIISTAKKIDLIVVCPPLVALQKQLYEAEIVLPKGREKSSKHERLLQLYKNEQWVTNMYCDWIEFLLVTKSTGVKNLHIYRNRK